MITRDELIESGFISNENYSMLESLINDGHNLLITGLSCSGKTTLADALGISTNSNMSISGQNSFDINSLAFNSTMLSLANKFNLCIIDECKMPDIAKICGIPRNGFRCILCIIAETVKKAFVHILMANDCVATSQVTNFFDYAILCKRDKNGIRRVVSIDKVNKDCTDIFCADIFTNIYEYK